MVAQEVPHPAAAAEDLRGIAVQLQGAVDGDAAGVEVVADGGDREAGEAQRRGIVGRVCKCRTGQCNGIGHLRATKCDPVVDHGVGDAGGDQRLGEAEAVVHGDRLAQQAARLDVAGLGEQMVLLQRAQIEIVGVEAFGGLGGGAGDFGALQGRLDGADDAFADPVLQVEDVGEIAFEAIGPDMAAGGGLDQLAVDAHAAAGAPHAALEHITDAKLAPDSADIGGFSLIGKTRIARDHEQPAGAGQRRGDVVDHAVGEIFLLDVAAHVGERQHRERGFVGQRKRLLRFAARDARGTPALFRQMFFSCCSPRSSRSSASLPSASSRTRSDRRMPPGSASASSRAAMLTPSPSRSPSGCTATSAECRPIRSCRGRRRGPPGLAARR